MIAAMTALDFRLIFEGSPSLLLVLDPAFRILAVTDAYLGATRTVREEIIGRGLFEVFPDNPDDPQSDGVSNLRASLEQVVLHRRPHTMALQQYDIQLPPEQGGGFTEKHWSPVNIPMLDQDGELHCIIHRVEDVTAFVQMNRDGRIDDRQTRELLRRSATMESELYARGQEMQKLNNQLLVTQQRFASVFDHARDAIVAIDADDTIRLANRAVYQQFGYATGALRGIHISKLLPEFQHQPPQSDGAAATTIDLVARRGDGTTFPAELSIGEFVMENGRSSVLIVRDISERHRLAQLKREFVATVNHELRTPLTSIRGAMDLIAHGAVGPISEEANTLVGVARRNGMQLAMLVDDLLDVERLDSGGIELRLQRTDLVPLLHAAIEINQPYAEQHGVTFRLTDAPADGWVVADPDRLQQVMANLLSNAAKFSSSASVVELGLEDRGERLRVFVQDHGIGIPVSFHGRIFERFAQADSSDRRRFGGTGLGLSISKSIVELHDGTIDFTSEPGVGTRFWFELPAA
jgi:PAS domain S-box-containing protein